MQRFWRWLISLFVNRRSRRAFWTIDFVPTKISEVDAELEVSKRAKEHGAAGLPSIMDTQPDFVHRLIFNHFHQKIAVLYIDAQSMAHHYDSQFSQLGIERIPEQVRSAPERFQQVADVVILKHRTRVDDLRERRANAISAYNKLKERYGLVADAEYPENKTGYFAFPVLLLGLEAAFNSFVFAGADPTGSGLAGGIRISLIIALINVVVAVLIGNSLRNLNSKDLFKKILGVLALCVAVLYIPLNLFWAHYRDRAIALKNLDAFSFDELIKLRMQVVPDAWDHFTANFLAVTSIESWGLFVLGCIVVGLSLADGYKMSDPIPGYEKLHRSMLKARGVLENLHHECLTRLEGASARIAQQLELAENSFGGQLAIHDGLVGDENNLETVYNGQMRDYVEVYKTVVQLYRSENRVHRGGQPVPEYFNREPEVLEERPFPADAGKRRERSKELRAYAGQITTAVSAANNEVRAKLMAAVKEIETGLKAPEKSDRS